MDHALQVTYMLQPAHSILCREERFWQYNATTRPVSVIFRNSTTNFAKLYQICFTQEVTNWKQHETYDVKYLSLAKKENIRTHPSDEIAPHKAREKIVEAEEADQRSAQRRTCFT